MDFLLLTSKILAAKSPTEIFSDFGALKGDISEKSDILNKEYHEIAKQVHPDKVNSDLQDKSETERDKIVKNASDAFANLKNLFDLAKKWVENNKWGDLAFIGLKPKVSLKIGKGTIYLSDTKYSGDICDVFVTEGGEVVKIPRSAEDNDLVKAESELLKYIWTNDKNHAVKVLPELKRTVKIGFPDGERICNIFPHFSTRHSGRGYTLKEVMQKYSDGLDLATAAWMWRRLLLSLTIIHHNGYVHGNIIPENFIIYPETHYGMLVSFTGAVKIGEKAIVCSDEANYKEESNKKYYPPEVFDKKSLTEQTDIYMAAKIMWDLLGEKGKYQLTPRIKGILNACTLNSGRLDDAWSIHEDFGLALRKIFGDPKWVEFKM